MLSTGAVPHKVGGVLSLLIRQWQSQEQQATGKDIRLTGTGILVVGLLSLKTHSETVWAG